MTFSMESVRVEGGADPSGWRDGSAQKPCTTAAIRSALSAPRAPDGFKGPWMWQLPPDLLITCHVRWQARQMGGNTLWAVWIFVTVLWGLGIGTAALNGITQIATGGPGFLPLERWFRKRRPATRGDFVLRGAAEVVQALGFTLVAAPMTFLGLVSTVTLTTGWHPPSPPEVPILVGLAVFGVYVGSLFFGFFCVVYAYLIYTKVNYVRIDVGVEQPA